MLFSSRQQAAQVATGFAAARASAPRFADESVFLKRRRNTIRSANFLFMAGASHQRLGGSVNCTTATA
jgi:hypothetical protein